MFLLFLVVIASPSTHLPDWIQSVGGWVIFRLSHLLRVANLFNNLSLRCFGKLFGLARLDLADSSRSLFVKLFKPPFTITVINLAFSTIWLFFHFKERHFNFQKQFYKALDSTNKSRKRQNICLHSLFRVLVEEMLVQ